jgi:transcriptional regulator GlxA family with amidase domain
MRRRKSRAGVFFMDRMAQRRTVGIVIFEDVEVLDFCGPFEVFSIARFSDTDPRSAKAAFDVVLVAETADPISTIGGMRTLPTTTFADCPPLDIAVIPGGWGTRRQLDNPVMLDWLRARAEEVEILASVCTGALVLGAAGLLDGRRATTHWRVLDQLRDTHAATTVIYDEHVVEDGNLFTSAGISAGLDMALRVVARCVGEPAARAAAKDMEYPYPDDNRRRVEIDD